MIWLLVPVGALALLVGAGVYLGDRYLPHIERARKGKVHILCLGDSITFGSGVLLTRRRNSYPALLKRELGRGIQVLNFGVPGATMCKGGKDAYPKRFLAAVVRTRPRVIVLMLGTNDSKPSVWDREAFERAMQERIGVLRGAASHLILAVPPAAFSSGEGEEAVFRIRPRIIAEEIVPCIRETALRNGLTFVDLFLLTKGHPEWFADGVHPNAEGNRHIAAAVSSAVRNAMKEEEHEGLSTK